ncbi:hypothetical protein K469DRAFT_802282 [Zopfia rhizophila CBS 207.26]|uniref:Uncharacterized protein n=1 Tax=Zopfia rhizophila CBS 207.26 TaxID=1314779 RepID=A0A6A6DMF2_9PEZI|nr:hypothetical protein K469DRAFT_802282 [Zopfia rhizophila CBS 207.26]
MPFEAFIRSQPNPNEPVGTIISVNFNRAGVIYLGSSAHATSKLANHRSMEYLNLEYPTLWAFTLIPGIMKTDLIDPSYELYGKDKAGHTGALALYLASTRGDYLKGSLTSINWDIEEMEAHKEEIKNDLLKTTWIPFFLLALEMAFND